MSWLADYPGAIVVEAAHYGYGTPNKPKTWGFHTPEEPADSYPSTPDYLATTDRDASYTYFDSHLGFIFQLVPESEGAYAHGLDGKPAPSWSDGTNLNLQSFSLSFEGHAATIHQTMPRGGPQWKAGVQLVAHRTKALGLNLGWAFQHKEVSIYRSDCGQWDQAAFIADVKAEMEDDMAKFIQYKTAIAVLEGGVKWTLPGGSLLMKLYPEHQGNVIQLTEAEWKSIPNAHGLGGGSGGATPDQFVDKLKERL